MASTAEKYTLEIEFFSLSRGFRAQISRSCAQKDIFSSRYAGSLEKPTFSTESTHSSHAHLPLNNSRITREFSTQYVDDFVNGWPLYRRRVRALTKLTPYKKGQLCTVCLKHGVGA